MIILSTVPHTGTTFFKSLFERNGLDVMKTHCNEWQHVRKALSQTGALVTTLRHPFLVEESWMQRGKDVNNLIMAYELWLDQIYPNALVVSVDSPKREEMLSEVAEILEFDPATDWKPERVVSHTCDFTYEQMTPSDPIKQLSDKMGDVLECFY